MRYLKTLAAAAVIAAALPGAAGANPSNATSPAGTVYTGNIHMTAGLTVWHNAVDTNECSAMTVAAKIEWDKASGQTAGGEVSTFDFSLCNRAMTVLKNGEISINSAGTVFSTGAEITVHGPFGVNCIYTTNNTAIGTITGGSPAELDINSASIPRTGHSAFCGSTWTWTGSFTINTPNPLFIS